MDKDNNHIKNGVNDKFKGSMMFASKYSFNFVQTSRRDDLISLCYILIYLIDEIQLGYINRVSGLSKKEKFKTIKKIKLQQTARDLCGSENTSPDTYRLTEFVQEVFNMKFEEEPNYNKLRFILAKSLLDMGQTPNRKYDWIPNQRNSQKRYVNKSLFVNQSVRPVKSKGNPKSSQNK